MNWKRYGGRGISVCKKWRADFSVFAVWALANGYADDLQIDRIDNDGGYEPRNCRFVTPAKNAGNRSTSKLSQADIAIIVAAAARGAKNVDLARRYGVHSSLITYVTKGRSRRAAEAASAMFPCGGGAA